MATCDTEALMEAGKCLSGLDDRELEILRAQLLCEIYGVASEVPPVLYQDLRIAAQATKLGGSNDPDWVQFKTNGAGSRGVYTYAFSNLLQEQVFFSCQMPHGWNEGTSILWHVHWSPTTTAIGNVVWGLEYTWANINGTFGNTTLVGVVDPTEGVVGKHQMTPMVPITATGKESSSMLICRLFRDVANTTGAGANTYGADAFLLETDFHYQIVALGEEF